MGDGRPHELVEGVGRRVASERKLAGLTQDQLAARAHVSVSLVRHVEQGTKPASPAFVAQAAKALRVSVPELYGQITPRPDVERAHVADLETTVMAGVAPADVEPMDTLKQLAARVEEVAELQRHGRYDLSSGLLLGLLEDLHGATEAFGSPAATLLSRGYVLTSLCLHRLGSPVAAQAGERGATAARQGNDPLLAGVADVELGMRVLHRGAYAAADRLAARGRAVVEDLPATVETLSVRGHTHLSAAITAARAGDSSSSSAHLAEAAACAAHVPDGLDLYDTAFGPSNLIMHSVAAAVEMGDGPTALERDAPLGAVIPSRRAHHHVDMARASLLHGDRDLTLEHLQAARAAAPQVTRHHPQVAETLRVLAESDRRRTDSLAGFARWAGVTV